MGSSTAAAVAIAVSSVATGSTVVTESAVLPGPLVSVDRLTTLAQHGNGEVGCGANDCPPD